MATSLAEPSATGCEEPLLRLQIVLVLLVVAASIVLELLADTQAIAGIWWTHAQVMGFAGIIVVVLGLWMLVGRSD
jgi:protein-S-isoprenylcysteine O-methyltransferase Ste14